MVSGQQSVCIICRLSELLTFYLARVFQKNIFWCVSLLILISFLSIKHDILHCLQWLWDRFVLTEIFHAFMIRDCICLVFDLESLQKKITIKFCWKLDEHKTYLLLWKLKRVWEAFWTQFNALKLQHNFLASFSKGLKKIGQNFLGVRWTGMSDAR